jgi:hypothetical protein
MKTLRQYRTSFHYIKSDKTNQHRISRISTLLSDVYRMEKSIHNIVILETFNIYIYDEANDT